MNDEKDDFAVFQGIGPKPPPSPNLAHLFKCSSDYGGWRDPDEPEQRKQKHKKDRERRRKRGKIRLFPDE